VKKLLTGIIGAAAVAATGAASAANIGTAAAFVDAMTNEPGGSHTLTADIDLTDSEFVTVSEFSGVLDGGEFTISGVGKQPLIQLLTGTVKNLTLDGMVGENRTTMSCGKSAPTGYGIGALCVSNFCGRIECSTVKGYEIYGTSTEKNITHYFGPFAARAIGSAVIVDCVSTNNMIGGDRYAKCGGIVGNASYSSAADGGPVVSGCVNYSRLYGRTYSNGEYLGGIIGTFGGTADKVAIVTNCVNYGKVRVESVKDVNIGGIAGGFSGEMGAAASTTLLVDCVNRGPVLYDATSNGKSTSGGIVGSVGENVGGFTMLRCVNYGEVTLGAAAAGDAAGIINAISSEYRGSGIVIQDCANYGNVTAPNGLAAGMCAYMVWHPSYNCCYTIRNCANYGVLNGSDHAKDYQLIPSVTSRGTGTCDCSNYVKFLNCFVTGTPLYLDPMPNPYTVTNCISSTDAGYNAQEWCAKLNAEAKTNGWAKWAVGQSGHPEFKFLLPEGFLMIVR